MTTKKRHATIEFLHSLHVGRKRKLIGRPIHRTLRLKLDNVEGNAFDSLRYFLAFVQVSRDFRSAEISSQLKSNLSLLAAYRKFQQTQINFGCFTDFLMFYLTEKSPFCCNCDDPRATWVCRMPIDNST